MYNRFMNTFFLLRSLVTEIQKDVYSRRLVRRQIFFAISFQGPQLKSCDAKRSINISHYNADISKEMAKIVSVCRGRLFRRRF